MYNKTYLQVKLFQEIFFNLKYCMSLLLVIRILCLELSRSIIYTKAVRLHKKQPKRHIFLNLFQVTMI